MIWCLNLRVTIDYEFWWLVCCILWDLVFLGLFVLFCILVRLVSCVLWVYFVLSGVDIRRTGFVFGAICFVLMVCGSVCLV